VNVFNRGFQKVSDISSTEPILTDADLDELADKAFGIETVTVPKSKIPKEVFTARTVKIDKRLPRFSGKNIRPA